MNNDLKYVIRGALLAHLAMLIVSLLLPSNSSTSISSNETVIVTNAEEEAAIKVLVVPTNEELEIAKQCYQLVGSDE